MTGIAGNPAVMVTSVRSEPGSKMHRMRTEIIEAATEKAAIDASRLLVESLERDPLIVRIIVAPVASEMRRVAKEVFGRQVVLPFNRVNGKH